MQPLSTSSPSDSFADTNELGPKKGGKDIPNRKKLGSGGTMTSLADLDARLTGDATQDSLYVLRRGRLNGR